MVGRVSVKWCDRVILPNYHCFRETNWTYTPRQVNQQFRDWFYHFHVSFASAVLCLQCGCWVVFGTVSMTWQLLGCLFTVARSISLWKTWQASCTFLEHAFVYFPGMLFSWSLSDVTELYFQIVHLLMVWTLWMNALAVRYLAFSVNELFKQGGTYSAVGFWLGSMHAGEFTISKIL